MNRKLLYIIALFTAFSSGYAQEGKVKKANENFEKLSVIDARQMYLKLAESGYESPEVFKKLGDSYYLTAEPEKSLEWYSKLVLDGTSDIEPIYYLRYAQALKSVQDYENADKMMEAFHNLSTDDSRGEMFLKERDYLDVIKRQSGRFEAERTGFNSPYQDFSPSFYGDDVVFSSNRVNAIRGVELHSFNDLPFLDLYKVKNPQGGNGEITKLDKNINSKYHESSSVFTSDGNTMYFTRNNYSNKKLGKDGKGTALLKLYMSTLENGDWSDPVELPFNSDDYSVAHPALSPDGTTLYFASDMEGTRGLSDLWKVNIQGNNTYSTPINLGDNINTEGRETFPFIGKDGTLYFATDGHVGLGGLDVFVAALRTDGLTGEAFNAGKPVNSPSDDFGLIIDDDSGKGYFSSNRGSGEGYDDIYTVIKLEDLITDCSQRVEGTARDLKTDELLSNVTISLLDKDGTVLVQGTTDASGVYNFEDLDCNTLYLVRASKKGYQGAEVAIQTDNELDRVIQRNVYLDPPIGVGVGDDLGVVLNLNPIYFDLDKSNIRPDAAAELLKVVAVMEQLPSLKVDVRSHTDSRANDDYNLALSKRRNASTRQFLVDKGISPSRLSGDGYGETELKNNCANGVPCSEALHQLNRRSEFIVVNK